MAAELMDTPTTRLVQLPLDRVQAEVVYSTPSPPSNRRFSAPPAKSISSSAASTAGWQRTALFEISIWNWAQRRISSLINAALTPFVRLTINPVRSSDTFRPRLYNL